MAKYIGPRVVPIHEGDWSDTKAYEALSLVYDAASGNSYISKRDVPAGTALTNEDYWAHSADFSAQMRMATTRLDDMIATEKAERVAEIAVERARINQFTALGEGSTTGDAELIDLRVGADGKVYDTAGEAVRGQVGQLSEAIGKQEERIGFERTLKHDDFPEPFSENLIYRPEIGIVFDSLYTSSNAGALSYKFDISGVDKVEFIQFNSTSDMGSFTLDENEVVTQKFINRSEPTFATFIADVGANDKYFVYSLSGAILSSGIDVYIKFYKKGELVGSIEVLDKLLTGESVSKTDIDEKYAIFSSDMLYDAANALGKSIDEIATSRSGDAYAVKIPLDGYRQISYPVFKSSSVYGSLMFDENDVCVYAYCEKIAPTGTMRTINVPNNASYLLLSVSATLSELDFTVDLIGLAHAQTIEDTASLGASKNNNLCLCAVKTDIVQNAIPYARGYLFHKLQNDDGSIYFGNNFGNIKKVGNLGILLTDYMVACSPSDGRVILTRRNQRGKMYVWDGVSLTELFTSAELQPMGWLYNSGVEFTVDSSGNEICLFAEYTNTPTVYATEGFKVWRGVYPYTSESDWTVVYSQNYGGNPATDITHFHQIRRDPWTEILYLTSGDDSALSKWWYSTNYGLTWTLLTDGQSSGFEDHICRCINFVFTKDWIYFATDHGTNHCLNKIARNENTNIIDVSTREIVCALPDGAATNSICYVDSPKGIFMYDRIDIGYDEYYGKGFDVQFWSIEDNKLHTVMHINLTSDTWGGHRGKCYLNYTNSVQPYPAMGFSIDTPCLFDVVADNVHNIGTVYYEIMNKVLRTVNQQ